MKKTWVFFIALSLLTLSCEKALFEEQPADNPAQNFKELWTTVDKKYSFFAYKNIDWDSIRQVYRPQVKPGMSRVQLFDVFSQMLGELRDGHVNLSSTFDVSRYWGYYLEHPANFDYEVIERNYLGEEHEITGPFKNTWLNSAGYIYYGSFGSSFSESQVNYLLTKYRNADALIIDVRNNGGGYTRLIQELAGHFTSEKYLYAKEYYQNGPGHEDFAPPKKKHIEPSGGVTWSKPVILITNRQCYSATNTFALAMKQLDHVTIVGDRTGGGGGIPISAELPNGWTYRFSASKTLGPDGFNIEHGIPPDYKINLDENEALEGKDTMIEFALDLISEEKK